MKEAARKTLPPYWLVKAIGAIRRVILYMHDHLYPSEVVLYEKFQQLFLLPPLYVAALLDVAGLLRNGPLSIQDLARRTACDEPSLSRVMHTLASQGIFRITGNGLCSLTPLARPLLQGPGSLREVLLQHLGPENWQSLGTLIHTVKTGENAFQHITGKPIYQFLEEHPEKYDIFGRSMACLSELGLAPILQRYPFDRFPVIADIGGGDGSLLQGIMEKHPGIHGILFDTGSAMMKLPNPAPFSGKQGSISLVTGDFFEPINVKADCYLLKNVLHNWGDDDCVRILKNISASMPPAARLIIIEMILPPANRFSTARLIDIQMLATMRGGRERTEDDFRFLLRQAGLHVNQIFHTIAPVSMIEACR